MWERRRANGVSDAERAFSADADMPQVVTTVAGLMKEVRLRMSVGGPNDEPLTGTTAVEMRSRLSRLGLHVWAGRLALLAGDTGPATDPDRIMAELAMGAGLGWLCGHTPDRASFEVAEAVSGTLQDAWRSFPAAADRALQETPNAPAALAAFVRVQVDDFTAAPRRMARVSGLNTCAMVESHRRGPRLSEAWDESRSPGLFHLRWPEAFAMLYRCDARLYLEIVEAFPHSEPARQALEAAHVVSNSMAMAGLLTLAPQAFDGDGTWRVNVKTPFLLLGLAEHAMQEANTEADRPDAARIAAEAVAGPLIDALLARTDAAHLGHAWAERLILQGSRLPSRRAVDTSCIIIPALATVLNRLVVGIPMLDDPHAWLKRGEETWHRERALAVAAAITVQAECGPDRAATFLAQAAQSGSLWTTGAEQAIGNDTMESRIVSTIIGSLEDPAGWFDHSWHHLASVRDQARHFVPDRTAHGHGGHLLLAWAMCGLLHLPQGSERAKQLWLTIERAVRVSRITEWHGGRIPTVLSLVHRYLAGLWQTTFPDDPPATQAGSLEPFLRPFARATDTLAELAVAAWTNGVTADRLARAVSPSPGLGVLLVAIIEDRAERRRSAWAAQHNAPSEFDERLKGVGGSSRASLFPVKQPINPVTAEARRLRASHPGGLPPSQPVQADAVDCLALAAPTIATVQPLIRWKEVARSTPPRTTALIRARPTTPAPLPSPAARESSCRPATEA